MDIPYRRKIITEIMVDKSVSLSPDTFLVCSVILIQDTHECGRIADNLKEFFGFVVNCPYWEDYLDEGEYQDRESLGEFAKEVYDEHTENEADLCGYDLPKAQQELADCLGIEKKADVVDILMRFYQCTKREPRFNATYIENDGSTHSGSCSLFDR